MISPTVLLTAAHCIASGGSADSAGGTNWLAQPQENGCAPLRHACIT